jgi:hypothetical protein
MCHLTDKPDTLPACYHFLIFSMGYKPDEKEHGNKVFNKE